MKVRFDTESVAKYEFANGSKPRGTGAWMFEIVWSDGRGAHTSGHFSAFDTFSRAKADAMRDARTRAPSAATSANVSIRS